MSEMVEVAAGACRRAGALLLESFSRPARVSVKSSRYDLVTEYDTAAEQLIRQELSRAFPGSVVVGEEGGVTGSGELAWYVDPIDGTHNFARGLPLFCVSIGVARGGRPVAGCVYDPVRDELFSADADGFRLNGEPVRGPEKPSGALMGAGPPSPDAEGGRLPMLLTDLPNPGAPEAEVEVFRRLLATADVRRIGSSALALAYVAAGRADVAANTDTFPWDIAAGRVLVTASGGRFTELPARGSGLPGGFVAWRPSADGLGRSLVHDLGSG
ncbi:inositol monophosphatase family protein [Nonomuraea longicatena]|uniref:Inositol-1-monophosphatase n=1 Tax=Nonomuraea longicatena TaxID=83682 RepID=A0ABN1Q3F5_9ACTN